jgi:hypothetical protein
MHTFFFCLTQASHPLPEGTPGISDFGYTFRNCKIGPFERKGDKGIIFKARRSGLLTIACLHDLRALDMGLKSTQEDL